MIQHPAQQTTTLTQPYARAAGNKAETEFAARSKPQFSASLARLQRPFRKTLRRRKRVSLEPTNGGRELLHPRQKCPKSPSEDLGMQTGHLYSRTFSLSGFKATICLNKADQVDRIVSSCYYHPFPPRISGTMADVDMADAPPSDGTVKKKTGSAGESGKALDVKKRFEVKKVGGIARGRQLRKALNADLFRSGTPSPCGHGTLSWTTAPSAEITSWTSVCLASSNAGPVPHDPVY